MQAPSALLAQGTELTGLAGLVVDVVEALGPVGIGIAVAVENLFPPIPSEVVLPLGGFLAGRGAMAVGTVMLAATAGSVVGALALYALGATLGEERLRRVAVRLPLVEGADVDRASSWFHRHGAWSVLIGRLVPIVRSLVSIPAGAQRMPLSRFCAYTVIGSGVWNAALIGAGYVLGEQWEQVRRYADWLNVAVVVAIVALVLRFAGARLRRG